MQALSHRNRRFLRLPALGLALTFVFAITVAAYARGHETVAHQDTPRATVRDFLGAAVVDEDGLTACDYLTEHARTSVEHGPARVPSCEMFFGGAGLTLGGLRVQSDHDLHELSYRVVALGGDRRVIVSHGGQSIAFLLRPASPAQLEEIFAPPTPWRIDSSVAALNPGRQPTEP